jgi:NAD(P)-dependent dehydrogenase (short-subunit alcohol dehydrogenase family)
MEVSSSSITINSLFSVSGKNVLITGGSRGIGLMIAKTFVLAGANVLLTSRSEQACKDATESIIRDAAAAAAAAAAAQQNHNFQSSQNPINTRSIRSNQNQNQNQNQKVQYVASNVSNRDGCEELAKYTAKIFNNKLDILINNAGSSWGEPLERTSGKANWGFDKVLDLNIKGVFYLTRACIPLLENAVTSSKDPSRIINIGSVVGMIPQAGT